MMLVMEAELPQLEEQRIELDALKAIEDITHVW